MNAELRAELNDLYFDAVSHIKELNGRSETFFAYSENFTAEIDYRATIGEDAGDRWTAPDWWIESEEIRVEGVYNEEGDELPELTEWMNKKLN